jgi:RHS repeat-associated protein
VITKFVQVVVQITLSKTVLQPTEVEFGVTGKIEYLYNAMGQKIQKNVVDPSTTPVVTDYMNGGFQYTNNVLSFFPHAEGYVNVTLGRRGSLAFNYVYQYKDHLGNNRLNFSIDPLGFPSPSQPNPLKIIEENHYYPFGLKHTSYNTNQYEFVEVENGNDYYMNVSQLPAGGVSNYKYKYNGKEYQDELGLNVTAMDFRMYDSAIGRFNGMDRLSEFAYSITPYRFAYNNPVYWNDPTGLFENLAHCPTCPNTPKFKSLIDDPNNEYLYDPETDTASKVLQLNEIEVEHIKPSSSSSNWSSWFYFHNGFTLWNDEGRGNTPGLKNGTIKHSINTKTIPTMSGPKAMRGNKNWLQTLLHAISNLFEAKQKGDTVEEIIKENNTPPSIEKQNAEPVAQREIINVLLDTTHHTFINPDKITIRRTGKKLFTGTPEQIQQSKDSINKKNKFYDNWWNYD